MPRETRDAGSAGSSGKTSAKPNRVSLASKDAVESGLFTSGPATIKESLWSDFKYGDGTKAQVWLVVYEREGETPYEQPYTLGKGWKVKDGELIALASQNGLPKNCNAMQHLVNPLEALGVSPELLESGDPSFLEGVEVILKRVPQMQRTDMKETKRRDGKERTSERTILEIEEIVSAPWKGKGKGKAAAAAEKPKGRSKPVDDDDDEDEEDEKPAPKGKAKGGRAAAADADDEPEGDADDLIESGIEALIAILEETSPIKGDDVEKLVRAHLKGNPQAKAIAAAIADPEELDKEKGWTYDGKKVKLA